MPNPSLKPTPGIAAAALKVCGGRGLVLSVRAGESLLELGGLKVNGRQGAFFGPGCSFVQGEWVKYLRPWLRSSPTGQGLALVFCVGGGYKRCPFGGHGWVGGVQTRGRYF
jgi:hypothetical protein